MDCRKPLVLFLGLLTGVGGCTYTVPVLRLPGATPAKKDEEDVVHKAPTYVAFADFRAKAALAPEHTPQQRQQFREEARLSYLKALEVDPRYLPAYLALARFLQSGEDYTGAVAVYQKALDLRPRDATLWFELGMCQCRARDWAVALGHLRKAQQLDPGNRQYATVIGYTLARTGQWEEAYAALAPITGEAKAHYDLARMLRHLDKAVEARQHVQAALIKDPNLKAARDLLDELDGKAAPAAIQTTSYSAPSSSSVTPATAPLPGPVADDQPMPTIITPGAAGAKVSAGTMSESARVRTPIPVPPLPIINARSGKE